MRSNKQILSPAISVFVLAVFVVLIAGCAKHHAEIEEQKEITRLVVEEVWNKGNYDVLDEQYDPDFVYHQTPFPDIEGLDAYKQFVTDNRTNYPDIRLILEDVVVEGDRIASRGIYTGTQEGVSPTLGISSGRQVQFSWCQIARKENDIIVEVWNYVDWLGFMQQIGYTLSPPITDNTFARVTVTQSNTETTEESIRLYKESVVPTAKKQKGFRGIMLLSDYNTGKGISISLWDSEADAIANEQSGYYKEQVGQFKEFFTAAPVRESYTVTVQE